MKSKQNHEMDPGGRNHSVAGFTSATAAPGTAYTAMQTIREALNRGEVPEGRLSTIEAGKLLRMHYDSVKKRIRSGQLSGWVEMKDGKPFHYTTEHACQEYRKRNCLVVMSQAEIDQLQREQGEASKKALAAMLSKTRKRK